MEDQKLPLLDHLEEIRRRCFVVLFFLILFSILSFLYVTDILRVLKMPAGDRLGTLAVFSPTAAILSFIKIAFSCGLALTVPVFLYELWMFIKPALDKRAAKNGLLFILSGSLLFISGVLFSFFFLIPASLQFLLSVGRGELEFIISLDSYISFVLVLALGGGVVFQMPMLVFVLSKFGILTAKRMAQSWRAAVVIILLTAAIITPTPDAVNMILMSLPMFMLYLLSIGVARIAEKK